MSALFVVAALLDGMPVVAADNPLETIPDNVGLVIRWQQPTETVKKAVDFVTSVDPKFGALVQPLRLAIGVVVSNPELGGVDKRRDWYAAVFPVAEGDPSVLFAVPATDVNAMKETIIGQFTFVVYKDWLLYTEDEALAKRIQSRIDGKQKSINMMIDEKSAAVMDRGELSIFLNVRQLRETYKQQLEEGRNEIDAQMAQMQNFAGPTPGMNLQAMFKVYANVFHGMLQTLEDTESVAASLRVTKEGVGLEALVRLTANSPTDKILKANKSSEMKRLDRLPPGSHVYLGASGDIKQLINWGMKFSSTMYANNADVAAAVDKATRQMSKLEFGAYLMSFGLADTDDGVIRMAAVTEVKPAETMRDISRKLTRSMAKLDVGFVKQEIELTADAEKYGKNSADLVVTRQEIDPQFDPLGMQKQFQRTLYGEEGQVQRIVYLTDVVAQTTGGGRASMEKLLKALAASEPGNSAVNNGGGKAFAAARSRLSKRANIVAMADLPAIAADFVQILLQASQFPIPIDVDGLKKELGDERSYVGLSLAGESPALRIKLHVPLRQAQSMTKLVRTIQQFIAQPQF
jgi:hypothetical protein